MCDLVAVRDGVHAKVPVYVCVLNLRKYALHVKVRKANVDFFHCISMKVVVALDVPANTHTEIDEGIKRVVRILLRYLVWVCMCGGVSVCVCASEHECVLSASKAHPHNHRC